MLTQIVILVFLHNLKVIEAGETVTIKSGRQAILADTVVDGDLVIEAGGDVFVPAGAGFNDL